MSAPNMAPFFSQIIFTGVTVMVIAIGAGLAIVIAAKTGATNVLRLLFDKYQDHQDAIEFKQRYVAEQRQRKYQDWIEKFGMYENLQEERCSRIDVRRKNEIVNITNGKKTITSSYILHHQIYSRQS
jgi:predicted nicotinamide N-methyase